MLWLRWLLAGLSLQRIGFDSCPGNIRFVLNEVALGQISVRITLSPCSIIPPVTHIILRIITSRKERIGNITIRQQIGLEETIMKEIERRQLTWYGHVQIMAEGRLSGIALRWMQNKREHEGDRRKTGWKEYGRPWRKETYRKATWKTAMESRCRTT